MKDMYGCHHCLVSYFPNASDAQLPHSYCCMKCQENAKLTTDVLLNNIKKEVIKKEVINKEEK